MGRDRLENCLGARMLLSITRPPQLLAIAALIGAISLLATSKAEAAGPSCAAHRDFTAVDFSIPLTEVKAGARPALQALKQFGVGTIIRYYDQAQETLPCKTLLPQEADAILAEGFSIAVVFQHNNDDPETFFSKTRGAEDARRSLALAAANGQPYGSTIYFGVDGPDQVIKDMVFEHGVSKGKPMTAERKAKLLQRDRSLRKHIRFYERFLEYKDRYFKGIPVKKLRPEDILPYVEAYFVEVNRVFQEAADSAPDHGHYTVSAYGSGLVCSFLLSKKLVEYCWLGQSTAWPEYDSFKDSKRWSLLQEKTTRCPDWSYARDSRKVEFDFNTPSASKPEFGQWSKKRPDAVPIAPPDTCPPLAPH